MHAKIANGLIKSVEPRDKPYEVTDSELPGFFVAGSAHGKHGVLRGVPIEGWAA